MRAIRHRRTAAVIVVAALAVAADQTATIAQDGSAFARLAAGKRPPVERGPSAAPRGLPGGGGGACPPPFDAVYADFSDVSAFTLNGDATTAGNALRAAPAQTYRSGTAFLTAPVELAPGVSFSTAFRFRLHGGQANGADGLAFIVQGNGATALGGNGEGMGYLGLPASLAVELDTYRNGYDPSANHVGIDLDGSMTSVATADPGFDLEDGAEHGVWIDYDGAAQTLEVRVGFDPAVRPAAPLLTLAGFDLFAQVGATAWVGFGAATGAAYKNHDVAGWTLDWNPCGACAVDAECDDGVVCNGAEVCQAGACVSGPAPCPGAACEEATGTCTPWPGGWWDPAWRKRQRCRLDNAAQAETLADFPVLFRRAAGDWDPAWTQDGGQDLRFVDADGATPLDHELDEGWNEAGTSNVWVRVPQVDGASDQDWIWVYFENPAAADAQQPAGVWRNGYVAVWHLDPSLADSTSFANHGANNNTDPVAGPFGIAAEFDGNDWIDAGNDASLSLTGALSIEAWVRVDDPDDNGYQRIVSKKNNWSENGGYLFDYNPRLDELSQVAGGSGIASADNVALDATWRWVGSRVSGSAAALFLDGADVTDDATVNPLQSNNRPLYLGRRANGSNGGAYFEGSMDEVRISSVARSNDWFAAQYLSMTDAFLVCEPVEDRCAADDATCDGVDDDCDGAVDEDAVCAGPLPALEVGRATAGGAGTTVTLAQTYEDPVVVATVQVEPGDPPLVARVGAVGPGSFSLRLQNPAGLAPPARTVHYLVVEKGAWEIDGVRLEAQTTTSTVTDENDSWIGEMQTYLQGYTSPVVVGQVMSDNDPAWSVFWCRGGMRADPPDAGALYTGKTVCEDPATARADETIGFVVFEAGHGTIGGVEFEAAVGADVVQGPDDGPPFSTAFAARFASAPEVAVASVAGLDGSDGAWAQLWGDPPATADRLFAAVDEDTLGDAERSHTTEQLGYVAFETEFAYTPAPCAVDAECDDGLWCNGAETCGPGGYCLAGTDPCPGAPCEEATQTCDLGPQARLESVAVDVDDLPATVPLANTYDVPVVACTVQLDANAAPVVPRVSNAGPASFDVRLQAPDGGAVAVDTVHCLVVEEGSWTVGGVPIRAWRVDGDVTAHTASWIGQSLDYGQPFAQPVVLGQVMTENDADWSVFWCRGPQLGDPPTAATLIAGKTVCEDPDTTRATETLGLIVLEAGHGLLAGVEYEAGVTADAIQGVGDNPPYAHPFVVPFASGSPARAIATLAGMDGVNGGWAVLHGGTVATANALNLAIDEDTLSDAERNHTTEQVGYLALAGDVLYGPGDACVTDFDCDDGDFCNGADACIDGTCQVIPIDCDDPWIDP